MNGWLPLGRPDRIPVGTTKSGAPRARRHRRRTSGGTTPSARSGWWLLAPLAGVFLLGLRLDRIEAERIRLERAIGFYERGLARLNDDWAGTGESGNEFADPKHLYAADLDLFGNGSVFQRLCAARTRRGMGMLAAWLLTPAPPSVIRERQTGVRRRPPSIRRPCSRRDASPLSAHALANGSMMSIPISSKSRTFLVATAIPRERAIAAICPSACETGRPAMRRAAAISA